MTISPIAASGAYTQLDSLSTADTPAGQPVQKFADMLNRTDKAVSDYAFGAVDAQAVVEALAEAEMALQAAVTVRDRVVGAYQELLRMPL